MTARAARRLVFYEAKVPELELSASRSLSSIAILNQMKSDLELGLLDPTEANDTISGYRDMLNKAVQLMQEVRQEASADTFTKEEGGTEVLSLLNVESK